MSDRLYGNEPRAEELIAEIYRQYTSLRQEGKSPRRVCLPVSYIRRLRIYHALMGEAADSRHEYLEHDAIFGLEFFVHREEKILVSE
jgi:hypothetical protein